jgi:hypothetical protein
MIEISCQSSKKHFDPQPLTAQAPSVYKKKHHTQIDRSQVLLAIASTSAKLNTQREEIAKSEEKEMVFLSVLDNMKGGGRAG